MDLQQLRYFTAVATHGSISAGAAALGVTQPTISQALQGLEHEMRTPLFARVGRGMVLTSAGYALLTPARRVLRASAAAREELLHKGKGLAARLDVSISPGAMTGVVPHLLALFLLRHKDVTLNARRLERDADIGGALRDNFADLVFTTLPLRVDPALIAEDGALSIIEVGEFEVMFAEPPGDSVEDRSPVQWDGRGSARRILAPPSDYVHSVFNGQVSALGASARPPIVAERRETRIGLVSAGAGSTYVGASSAALARKQGVGVHPLEPRLTHRIGMIYTGLSEAAAAFVDLVRTEANVSDKKASAAGEGGVSR